MAICLYLTGNNFINAAKTILLAHIPIMAIEGIITAVTVDFIYRVKPEMLDIFNDINGDNA